MEGQDRKLLLTAATEKACDPEKLHLLMTETSSSEPDTTLPRVHHCAHYHLSVITYLATDTDLITAITRARPSRVSLRRNLSSPSNRHLGMVEAVPVGLHPSLHHPATGTR